jgi:hypothetical protein
MCASMPTSAICAGPVLELRRGWVEMGGMCMLKRVLSASAWRRGVAVRRGSVFFV